MPMSIFESRSAPISSRLREGLDRLGSILRAENWAATTALGLNPTQAHVLAFLAGRKGEAIRVKDIAAQLGVSQPTATDSIAALERKDLVKKSASNQDARSVAVQITQQGRKTLKAIGLSASATEQSLAALAPREKTDLLLLLIKLIRGLQLSGSIPVQRMCVTCTHFRPNIYSDARNPHHCAFVNAAFGDQLLRLDCNDHEPADPASQAATWSAFNTGSAALQATNTE
jgi:DNA-binding MarR family transcriptional regulator